MNEKIDYEVPIPITFKELKELVNSLKQRIKDDTPIVLLDRNEVFYRIMEVMTLGENHNDPAFAAFKFEPFVLVNKEIVQSGKLDETEQLIQNAIKCSDDKARKIGKYFNSHGYFVVSLSEIGTLKSQANQVHILQSQNDELREHIDSLLIALSDQQEHIDNLLGMLSDKKN